MIFTKRESRNRRGQSPQNRGEAPNANVPRAESPKLPPLLERRIPLEHRDLDAGRRTGLPGL